MVNQCSFGETNGCLLYAIGCNFDKFIFSSNADGVGFYYIIRDTDGNLIYNSYNDSDISEIK
jgi:hypothetical protein